MRGHNGFTLVEVLVSAAILTFLIAGIYAILNIGNMTYYTDMCFLDLHQNARQSMHWMVKEMREAQAADINIVSIDSDDDRVTFDTPNEDDIQYYRDISDVNNDSIVKQIIREYPVGTYRILANDIGNLSFCCWHDNVCDADCSNSYLLEIQLTADKTASGRDLSFPLAVKLRLRND